MSDSQRNFTKIIGFSTQEFCNSSKSMQMLLSKAAHVRKMAQAPYSNYFVGAAVRSRSGRIYLGCNVERVSYTQGTHAEQNAIDSMVAAEGPTKIEMIAVIGGPKCPTFSLRNKPVEEPVLAAPCCGHCLQIIWENCYGDADTKIISRLPSGHILIATIDDLLPFRFGPSDLGIDYSKK